MENINNLVMTIVQSIVNVPEEVELSHEDIEDDEGSYKLINVRVNQKDVGLCIGSKGVTAEAIRRIVGIAGFKELGVRVHVNIDAPKLR